MATIRVEHSHNLGQDEAIKRAQDLIREFGHKLKAEIHWNGPNATFKGTGFHGSAEVKPSNIAVDVDLGLMLRPMKGTIEHRLEKALQEKFS